MCRKPLLTNLVIKASTTSDLVEPTSISKQSGESEEAMACKHSAVLLTGTANSTMSLPCKVSAADKTA
jgi:hypothetical protein